MSNVDIAKIRTGVKVTLPGGSVGVVRGSYMSADGLILRVKVGDSGITEQNVPFSKIVNIKEDE